MSLLRDIQADLSTKEPDLLSVLRKCKILAARLRSQEFARWVDLELNGYPEGEPIPAYRRVYRYLYANFSGAFGSGVRNVSVPWGLIDEDIRKDLDHREIPTGIAGIAPFTENGAYVPLNHLVFQIQRKLYPGMNCVGVWMQTGPNEFQQLVSAVTNRILDFVLKIEEENPEAGEAAPHTNPVLPERLSTIVQQSFYAPVGNVAQNSHDFRQTARVSASKAELRTLATEFRTHLDELNLSAAAKSVAEAQIATVEAQLVDEPDAVVIAQVGRTLRNVTEGAIGSLIASGAPQAAVWQLIQTILSRFH